MESIEASGININVTVEQTMGLIATRKKRTRIFFLIIKRIGKKKTIKMILMVVVILVVHMKGKIKEMIKKERRITL